MCCFSSDGMGKWKILLANSLCTICFNYNKALPFKVPIKIYYKIFGENPKI